MNQTRVNKNGMSKEVTQMNGFRPRVKKVQTNERRSADAANVERVSLQKEIENLVVNNPFEEKYDYQDFLNETNYLRNDVLPIVKRLGTSRMGYASKLKTKDLLEIFKEKAYMGELDEYTIKNSGSNRNTSLSEEGAKRKKLVRKLAYAVRLMGGMSSFNFIPIGIMDDIICLEAEDRGHQGTLVFVYWDEKWNKKTWKFVVTKLEEDYDLNPEAKAIVGRINELIKKTDKFSLSEILPNDIKDYWLNYIHPIDLKVYSKRDMHDVEILGINSLEDLWTTHQRAMKAAEKYLRDRFGIENTETSKRYDLVKDKPLFLGEKLMFSSHKKQVEKMEMPEEEILWLYLSSLADRKGSLDIYRGFDCTDAKKRYAQYAKAIEIVKFPLWKKAVTVMEAVASPEPVIKKYQSKIKKITKPYKDDKKSCSNIECLTPGKVDTALMYCYVVNSWVKNAGHKQTENIIKSAAIKMFQVATEMLDEKPLIKNLLEKSTGAVGRYEAFFSILEDRLEQIDSNEIVDTRQKLIGEAMTHNEQTTNGLPTTNQVTIIDRDENAGDHFHIKTICIMDGNGVEDGHQIPGDENGGHFLQFKGDNRWWGDKRTFNPKEYADEYLKDVKNYMEKIGIDPFDDVDWMTAFNNTRQFVTLWRNK